MFQRVENNAKSRGAKTGISLESVSQYATSHTGHQRSRTAMEKAKEDNDMMNIKDVLSPGEEVLFGTQQHRLVPGGKDYSYSFYVYGER
jgi:hypothetical protein